MGDVQKEPEEREVCISDNATGDSEFQFQLRLTVAFLLLPSILSAYRDALLASYYSSPGFNFSEDIADHELVSLIQDLAFRIRCLHKSSAELIRIDIIDIKQLSP